METSVLRKTDLPARSLAEALKVLLGVGCLLGAMTAHAEIIFQVSNGAWVGGAALSQSNYAMPSIVLSQTVRSNSGFNAQRAFAWSSYKRGDNSTGLLLTDPMGNGALTATNSRQLSLRNNMARANAYRLKYFAK